MNTNKIRVRHSHLLEDLMYSTKISTGRFKSLCKLLLKGERYVYAKSYYPEYSLKRKREIFFDQLKYVLKYGEINKFYFLVGLDRKDKNIRDFVSHLKLVHKRDKINALPPISNYEYKIYNSLCILRDKLTFGAFCKGIGIPTPANYAIVEKGEILLLNSAEIAPLEKILETDIDAFCKILNGGQGKGLFNLKIKENVAYKNDQPISIEELKQEFGQEKWLLQEKIAGQHDDLTKIYPHSINTIRLMTVNTGTSVEPIGALLRMGTGGKRVDNWSAGGIIVPIDKDGRLTKYGFFKPGYGTKMAYHSDSGIEFEGLKVPFFDEALKQAKYLHSLLHRIHSVGWDIGITKEGPIFIEGNDNWDVALYELTNENSKSLIENYLKS